MVERLSQRGKLVAISSETDASGSRLNLQSSQLLLMTTTRIPATDNAPEMNSCRAPQTDRNGWRLPSPSTPRYQHEACRETRGASLRAGAACRNRTRQSRASPPLTGSDLLPVSIVREVSGPMRGWCGRGFRFTGQLLDGSRQIKQFVIALALVAAVGSEQSGTDTCRQGRPQQPLAIRSCPCRRGESRLGAPLARLPARAAPGQAAVPERRQAMIVEVRRSMARDRLPPTWCPARIAASTSVAGPLR